MTRVPGRALRPARWTAAALVLAFLAGCSGPLLPPIEGAGGPVALMPVDQGAASRLVSDYRVQRGLSAVTSDPVLAKVAQAQADAMASADQLSHTVAGTLPNRLSSYGRERGASVENVSAGYGSLDGALGGWRRSAPHNANLLYGPMRRIGVAAALAPGTRYKTFWALVMTD